MTSSWKHPGRTGAVLYGVLAALAGVLVTVTSRLQIAEYRGARRLAKRLPPGGIIVISNHTSLADGILLAVVCRRMGRSLRMLATAGVFRVPVVGTIARRLGFIAVERGTASAAEALEPAVQALAAGEAVGIFPEGRLTRNPDKWPERGKTGAVRLAVRSGAPIVPVAMVGAHRVVERRRIIRQLLTNLVLRPRVETVVGEPIDVRAWDVDLDDAGSVRTATDRVMEHLVDLVEEVRGELAPSPVGVDPE